MRAHRRIIIEGGPFDRGRSYGEQARSEIETAVGFYSSNLESLTGRSWRSALDWCRSQHGLLQEYDPELWSEAEGIAAGAGRSIDEILALNMRTEISRLSPVRGPTQSSEGCTSFVVLPEATSDGHETFIGQNEDNFAELQSTFLLVEIRPTSGPRILTFTEAGKLAHHGLNEAGIAVCGNNLCTPDEETQRGVPMAFLRRKILQSETYGEALDVVLTTPRTCSANYLIATREGDGISLEATAKEVYPVFPSAGILTHANHFVSHYVGSIGAVGVGWANTLYRDRVLFSALADRRGTLSLDAIKQALANHHGGRYYAVCRHPDERLPGYRRTMSVASEIIDLQRLTYHTAVGPPCSATYQTRTLDT